MKSYPLLSRRTAPRAGAQRSLRIAMRVSLIAVAVFGIPACNDYNNQFTFAPYDTPNSVVIADMNGDGAPDLGVAFTHIDGTYPNAGFASVILQNNAARGTFQTSVDTAAGFNPSTLAVGDLDGTSGPDLVVSNANSANVSILLQDATATGKLLAAANVTTGGVPYDVAVGDLNNDGKLDIAVADAGGSGNALVLFQDPASPGHFLAQVTLAVGNPSTAVAIGDVDGDGRPDLVVANEDGSGIGRVSIFYQSATTPGTFLPRIDVAAGTHPLSVKIGDLNGDGRADIVVANERSSSSGVGSSGVSVLLQDAANPGAFLPAVTYATAHGSVCVAIGDLNNDGRPDLAVANTGGSRRGTVSVLLQDATRPGTFLAATNYSGVFEPLGLAIGDLNGDGVPDIAVADGDRATIMFNSATAPGTFAAPVLVGR